jgi:hypothetical protein
VSTLLSRIQPRPDLRVRVVTLDTDPTREVAVLHIAEGYRPPYMHSKGGEHRVYIRAEAQKAEADYLQLSALFEKRRQTESKAASFLTELIGPRSELHVMEATDPNRLSRYSCTFILAPEDDRASRRLTIEVERQFKQCVDRLYEQPQQELLTRNQAATRLKRRRYTGNDQRFELTTTGALGFVAHACIETGGAPVFRTLDFCRDFIDFLPSLHRSTTSRNITAATCSM